MAKIVKLQQNTIDWLDWRISGLGGSDANIIASYFLPDDVTYPFGSWAGAELYHLWCQKTGRIEVREADDRSWGNYVDPLVHGHTTEQAARDWYMGQAGVLVEPVCVQHDVLPYLIASLDGWDPGTAIVEIKCPKEPQYHRRAREGEIPSQCWAQLLHNMVTAGERQAHFVSYFDGDGVIIPVDFDETSADKLREAEEVFWSWVTSDRFGGLPPAGEAIDTSSEWADLIAQYFANQDQIRALESIERRLKREIHRRMTAAQVTGGGAKVSVAVRPAQLARKPVAVGSKVRDEYLALFIERQSELLR
jgi:putative phage-type endonuclease